MVATVLPVLKSISRSMIHACRGLMDGPGRPPAVIWIPATMVAAALASQRAMHVVNARSYSPGRRASSDGPGYFVYCLCRFGCRT